MLSIKHPIPMESFSFIKKVKSVIPAARKAYLPRLSTSVSVNFVKLSHPWNA